MHRIDPTFSKTHKNYKTKLCFCEKCTFAFYEKRLTEQEENSLYKGYRDAEYQRAREMYECWYTEKVNRAMNNDEIALQEQRHAIENMLVENKCGELKVALDYGGNEGKTFTPMLGTEKKYVYDVSGIPTIEGVSRILSEDDLTQRGYDFVMCNQVLEHLQQPMNTAKKLMELPKRGVFIH